MDAGGFFLRAPIMGHISILLSSSLIVVFPIHLHPPSPEKV